jgi:hypothetical protein
MASSTNAQEIQLFNSISDQLNRYLAPLILIFGVFGNILNCLVFSQKRFRVNSCAYLFLIASVINLISLICGLSTRILSGWSMDPTNTVNWLCKGRAFVVFTSRTIAIWLIMIASIDRWLLSSASQHRRQMSTIRNIKRSILVISIVCTAFYIHMLGCYEANLLDAPLKCYGRSLQCNLITDLTDGLMTICIPLIVMMIFGRMTISNVHQARRRVGSVATISTNQSSAIRSRSRKKMDQHLLRMLFLQIPLLLIFCLPQAVQKFYLTFHSLSSASELQIATHRFLYNLEILMAFIASGMPFYLNTLTSGTVFRRALFNLPQRYVRRLR